MRPSPYGSPTLSNRSEHSAGLWEKGRGGVRIRNPNPTPGGGGARGGGCSLSPPGPCDPRTATHRAALGVAPPLSAAVVARKGG
eukprot:gene23046-53408_t